jgi:hypothetical protein
MTPRQPVAAWIVSAGLLLAAPAFAQQADRPSEADLFGAPAGQPAQPAGETRSDAPSAGAEARPSEEALFGEPAEAAEAADPTALAASERRPDETSLFADAPPRLSEETAPEDPLKIGGQFYLRGSLSASEGQPPSRWRLGAPTLVDGYFDARPNDRVRGMVVGRLRYDPTLAEATSAAASPFAAGSTGPGPTVALDQLWLRFDLERTVFVTAGKQHVKWGTARFWNPTDFLSSQRRDPLAVFDERTGVTMLKLHAPWEATGANFYAIGLFEDVGGAGTLGQVGGAARAEFVLGQAEIGVDGYAQRGRASQLGFDFSAGIWELDLYGELALKSGRGVTGYRRPAAVDPAKGIDGLVESYELGGLLASATVGASWSVRYNDEDVLMLGAEYFYNPAGAGSRELYPWLIYKGEFTPFYVGQHYAGGYAVLMAPGSWNNTNFVFSTLGNLSDRSFVSRLDYSVVVLTHLRFEAWGAAHYGNKGGEFRFGLEIPAMTLPDDTVIERVSLAAPTFEAGLGLRVSL